MKLGIVKRDKDTKLDYLFSMFYWTSVIDTSVVVDLNRTIHVFTLVLIFFKLKILCLKSEPFNLDLR